MKDHVTSLEVSKRLKEAGVPQDTEFYYILPCQSHGMVPEGVIENKEIAQKWNQKWIISAPLATELLELLPVRIEEDETIYELEIYKTAAKSYMVVYLELYTKAYLDCFEARKDKLPDALGEMVLYLKEKG